RHRAMEVGSNRLRGRTCPLLYALSLTISLSKRIGPEDATCQQIFSRKKCPILRSSQTQHRDYLAQHLSNSFPDSARHDMVIMRPFPVERGGGVHPSPLLRQAPGVTAVSRANARENENSDSYPTAVATCASVSDDSRNRWPAKSILQRVR